MMVETAKLDDLLQDFSQLIEKKHRNLTKRKAKLDQYRQNLSKGITLNDDQKKSIEKYDSVIASINTVGEVIETTNDFHKRMSGAINAYERQREQSSKQTLQNSLLDWIRIQNFLRMLDIDYVKESICCEFSPSNYELLKSVSELLLDVKINPISPNMHGNVSEAFDMNYLGTQSGNIVKLLEGISKPIGLKGSKSQITYQDVRKLIFDAMNHIHVHHAMMGKPYQPMYYEEPKAQQVVPPVAEPTVIIPSEPVQIEEPEPQYSASSELYDKIITPVNSAYNFIHASRVSTNSIPVNVPNHQQWNNEVSSVVEDHEEPVKIDEEPIVQYSDEKENAPTEEVDFVEQSKEPESSPVDDKKNTWATILKSSDKNKNIYPDPTGDSRPRLRKNFDEKPHAFNHTNQNMRNNYERPSNGFKPRGGSYNGRGGPRGGFRGNRNGPRMNNYNRQNGGQGFQNRNDGHVSEVYQNN